MKEVISSSFQQGRSLAKSLSKGDLTPAEIRNLTPQQLYVAVLYAGEELLPDVVPFIGQTQYQLLLDFDFWEKDSFLPERFTHWLLMLDSEDSFELFHQFIEALPADILELATQHFVEVLVFEENTDNPPGPGWFTPDDGHLWLHFKAEDEHALRVLGRFFAYLFQKSSEMFYQLMLNINSATSIELQEFSLEDRQRRLLDEGLPDIDKQFELQSPMSIQQAMNLIGDPSGLNDDAIDSKQLQKNAGALEPFTSFIEGLSEVTQDDSVERLLSELAQILNTGLIVFKTAIDDGEQVIQFQQQVRGLVNIGLEVLAREISLSPQVIYHSLNLQGLYRLGLSGVSGLRSLIIAAEPILEDETLAVVHKALTKPIPLYPKGWCSFDGDNPDMLSLIKPFEHLSEVEETTNKIVQSLSLRP